MLAPSVKPPENADGPGPGYAVALPIEGGVSRRDTQACVFSEQLFRTFESFLLPLHAVKNCGPAVHIFL